MAAWTYSTNSGIEYFDITGVTTNKFWDVISTTLDAGHVYSISASTSSEANYDGIIISTIPLTQKDSGSLSSKFYGDNIILLCSGNPGGEGTDYTVGSSDQDIYIYFRTDTSGISPSSEEGHVTITDTGGGGSGGGSGATNDWDESVSANGNIHTFTISVDENYCFAKTYYTVTNGHTYSISVNASSEGSYDGIIVSTTNYSSHTAYSSMKSNSGCVAYASNSSNTVSYTAQTAGALYIYFVTDNSNINPNPETGTVTITEQGSPTPTQSTLNLVGTSVNYGSTAYIRATPSVAGTIYWGYSNSSMTNTKTNCTGGTTYDLTSRSTTGSTTVYAYLDPSSGSYSNSAVVNATMTVAGQNNITITLDRNGGSGGSSSISVAPGASASDYPTIYTPDRTGFGFEGYYTAKVGGTECVNDEGSPRVTAPTSNTTWYAHWTNALEYYPNTSISVYSGTTSATLASEGWSCGGGSPSGSISSVKKGSTSVTNLSSWGVNSTGTTLTIPSGQATGTYTIVLSITSPSSTTGNTYIGESITKTITLSITSQPTITISLNGNGGSGNQSSIQVTPGAAAGSWSVGTLPTRSGFTFIGYFSASTSGTQYTDASGTTVHAATQTPTTLYANWQPDISYTFLDNATAYCTSQAASYNTADGDISVPISSLGVVVPSGVTFTISELYYNFDFSSDGKNVIVPDGTVADEYQLCISIDTSSGSNYRSLLSQVFYAEFRLVAVTKYPNDTNPTKYKNTSGTTGTNVSYGTPTVSIGNGLGAGTTSATVSCSVPNTTTTWYWKYTNGVYSSQQSSSTAGTVSWSITTQTFTKVSTGTSSNISRFSKSSNTLSHSTMGTNVGTDYVLITAVNGGDSSKTATASKSITNSYTESTSMSYGTPEIHFSSDSITASGGRIVVNCSADNEETTTTTYTSGEVDSEISIQPATVVWKITYNRNNAFYEDGTVVNHPTLGYVYEPGFWVVHEDMENHARTDTFTVTAYNSDDTSKSASLDYDDVSNSLTWKNPVFSQPGTGSSKTVSLAVAGQEYTIVAAVTQQQSYTSGYVAQTVDVTNNIVYSVSTAKTGYSLNTSTHVVTVTNNESTSARNGFKVLLKCTGNANLVKNFTMTFNQAAGSQAYLNPVVTGFTYETFAAGGATKTPTVTYYQDYAWNGVAGSGTRTSNTGGTLAFGDMGITFPTGFSKGSNYATTGSATWANRTNVEGAARDCNNYLSVAVTMNGKTSTSFWCTSCVQEANSLGTPHYQDTSGTTGDVITYGTPTCILNTTNLTAGGGTYYVACDVNNTVKYYRRYTSGTYTSQYSDTQAGTAKWKISSQTCAGGGTRFSTPTGGSNLSGVGTVYTGGSGHPGTHSTMGTNEGTDTINVISYNVGDITKTNTASGSVSNPITWDDISLTVSSPATPYSMAVSGETVSISASATQSGSYASGSAATGTVTIGYAVQTSKTGFSLGTGSNSNKVTVTNNNSTSARNGFVVRVTATGSGSKTATSDRTFNQAAGAKVYANPTVTGYSYANFSAAGESSKYPTVTYTQDWTWNGVSGSGDTDSYTYNSSHTSPGGTLAFTASTLTSGFSKGTNFATSGRITAASRGTTIGNERNCTSKLSVVVTVNSKASASFTCISCVQNGNYVTEVAPRASSGTTHIAYADIGPGATSAPVTTNGGATYTFTSGSTSTSVPSTSYGSVTYSRTYTLESVQNGFTAVNSSGTLTVTSKGTTVGGPWTSGNVKSVLTVTWTHSSSYSAGGTKSGTMTSTVTCTQTANALTSLSISVGTNPINYGGTSTCTVTATYTSGATKNVDCDTNTTYSFNPTGIVTVTKS